MVRFHLGIFNSFIVNLSLTAVKLNKIWSRLIKLLWCFYRINSLKCHWLHWIKIAAWFKNLKQQFWKWRSKCIKYTKRRMRNSKNLLLNAIVRLTKKYNVHIANRRFFILINTQKYWNLPANYWLVASHWWWDNFPKVLC